MLAAAIRACCSAWRLLSPLWLQQEVQVQLPFLSRKRSTSTWPRRAACTNTQRPELSMWPTCVHGETENHMLCYYKSQWQCKAVWDCVTALISEFNTHTHTQSDCAVFLIRLHSRDANNSPWKIFLYITLDVKPGSRSVPNLINVLLEISALFSTLVWNRHETS